MKKILFVSPHMITGGVEKALINLLRSLPPENFKITLRLANVSGDFLDFIPNYVHIDNIPVSSEISNILVGGGCISAVKKSLFSGKIFRASMILAKKLLGNPCPEFIGNWEQIPIDKIQYDIAICFHMHMPFIVRYTSEKIISKKKYLWLHNDFSSSGFKANWFKKYQNTFDCYFCVGTGIYDEFTTQFPTLKSRSHIFYNIVDIDEIKRLACSGNGFTDQFEGLRILSIGRLTKQKGFYLAIEAMAHLKKRYSNVKWYVLGSGELEAQLKKSVEEAQLVNDFIFLGTTPNPYPYIQQCDIYCQPSLHEAFCTTVNEARILMKPIITTNTAGANEMINNNVNGLVVEPTVPAITAALELLISGEATRLKFAHELKSLKINTTMLDEYF